MIKLNYNKIILVPLALFYASIDVNTYLTTHHVHLRLVEQRDKRIWKEKEKKIIVHGHSRSVEPTPMYQSESIQIY